MSHSCANCATITPADSPYQRCSGVNRHFTVHKIARRHTGGSTKRFASNSGSISDRPSSTTRNPYDFEHNEHLDADGDDYGQYDD